MATTNSVKEFLNLMSKRDKAFKDGASKAFKKVVFETTDYAHQNLEGTITTKQLRAMGHPFARAAVGINTPSKMRKAAILKGIKKVLGKGGKVNLLPINRQTGKLQKAAYLKHFKQKGMGETYEFGFNGGVAPYAKYVLAKQGTDKMRQRGYWIAHKLFFYKQARRMSFSSVGVK
jgi:hypothetical protein